MTAQYKTFKMKSGLQPFICEKCGRELIVGNVIIFCRACWIRYEIDKKTGELRKAPKQRI